MKSQHKRIKLVLIISVVLVLALAACGGDDGDDKKDDKSLTPVAFQLSWTHEYSSAPFYFALENNHLVDAGLDFTLLEGGFNAEGEYIDGIQTVLNGDAQFGTTDLSSLLQARSRGEPIVAIGTSTVISPFVLISMPDAGITSPEDLVGKTVSITEGGTMLTFSALLEASNIDPADVTIVPRTSFGVDPLLNGDVDVLGGWIINEGYEVQQAGYEPNFIIFSDYGIDFYDFLLFTTEDIIANNPAMVRSFMTAYRAGLQDTIANPDKGAELAVAYNNTLDLEGQKARMQIYLPLINPVDRQLTRFDPNVFEFNYNLLLAGGMLDSEFDITEAYTLEFVE